jgi:hypothetical protein
MLAFCCVGDWAMQTRLAVIIAAAAALAACETKPDLRFQELTLSTPVAAPGGRVDIRSTVINRGNGPVADEYGAPIAAGVDINLFEFSDDVVPISQALGRWALPSDYPLGPGESKTERTPVLAPTNIPPGAYFICGDIDLDRAVDETNERNNRRCAPLSLTGGPVTRADLVIESAKFLGTELASAKVLLKVRNVGEAPAAPFSVSAFQRSPRTPVLVTACALTESQRVAGSLPACGGVGTLAALPKGSAVEWTAYVTFRFAGTNLPTNPIGETPTTPSPKERLVDFMADGCQSGAGAPLPNWCRVDEMDELNNFFAVKVKAP